MASWNKLLAVAAALTLMVVANGEVFFEENFDGESWHYTEQILCLRAIPLENVTCYHVLSTVNESNLRQLRKGIVFAAGSFA